MDKIKKYDSTAHLQGSALQFGDSDKNQVPYSEIRGRYIVVEEKADAANSAVSFNQFSKQLLQSRGHSLDGGWRERHFDLFKRWAAAKEVELYSWLGDQYIMYGEWMYAKHTIFYDNLPHMFLEFDIYDRSGERWLSTAARQKLLGQVLRGYGGVGPDDVASRREKLEASRKALFKPKIAQRYLGDESIFAQIPSNGTVVSVPILYEGIAPSTLAELLYLIQPSVLQTPTWRAELEKQVMRKKHELNLERVLEGTWLSGLMEGLYIKLEEGDSTVGRLKWVCHGFLQTIADDDTHWLDRPILPNQLAKGVDIFSDTV